jgi:hypothetical protein
MSAPETIPRYPLTWPLGWPRARHRANAQFKETVNDGGVQRTKWISMDKAVRRLEAEIDRLGGSNAVLSTNVRLNMRGIPYGTDNPTDPGAAVYFTFKGRARVFACDKWTRVADNVAAIAAHIDALRRVDRYGVGSIEQALEGYKALPADSAADWRTVFGFARDQKVTVAELDAVYKAAARTKHPDRGGSDDAMMQLNRAREFALAELGA